MSNPPIIADKFTTHADAPFVVFLLGFRVNHFRQFGKWIAVARAFPPMIDVLRAHPEKGMLWGDSWIQLNPISVMLISYWRSFDDLERFARAKTDPHLKTWREFNQKIGHDGSVGIWHETFIVEPGKAESLYLGMPQRGLAAATGHIDSVTHGAAHLRKGRGRLTGQDSTLPPELEVYE